MKAWQLKQRQGHPLIIKERMTERRIINWHDYHQGNVYVSFSGGKDSTVLLHQVRKLFPDVPAVFCDTGLEYPEIRDFVKTIDNVIYLKPKMSFKKVIEKYGYPVISKAQSQFIRQYRTAKSEKTKMTRLLGNKNKVGKISDKWKFLINAPFKISEKCCDVMKKIPSKTYEKKTNRKPFIGTMAVDSNLRKQMYLQKGGCNGYNTKRAISTPLSFWLEKDIWDYIKKYNVSYSKIYDMGQKRTGCMFCMFGVHLEKEENRFQKMESTHYKLWDYCINKLGCGKVLDFIDINYHQKQLTLF